VWADVPAIRRVSKDLILVKAGDYEPQKTDQDYVKGSDVPWLDRFAADGGYSVISGDTKMMQRHHEKLCLYEHGFVTILFEAQWNNWNFFRKTALLLHWWEEVTTKIKTADKGTFWVVPAAWPQKGGALKNTSLGLAQLLKDRQRDVPTTRKKRRRQAPRATPATDARQDGFLGDMEKPGPDKSGEPRN
jgi:hypothetical protein